MNHVTASPPCCASCGDDTAQFWALDTPNNECAETCLDPNSKVQMAEWWVLTGGKGQRSNTTMTTSPCADAGFSVFNRTDTIGMGPFKEQLDKFLPDDDNDAEGAGPSETLEEE